MKHTLIETEKASVLIVDTNAGFTLSGNRLEWPARGQHRGWDVFGRQVENSIKF